MVVQVVGVLPVASHSHDQGAGTACVIPANASIELLVEDGWQGVIKCNSNGTVEVYYQAEQPVPGEDVGEPMIGAEEIVLPGAPTNNQRAAASDASTASTRRSEKGCVGHSTQYDVVSLRLTRFGTRLDYQWTSEEIKNVKAQMSIWARPTENSTVAFGDWHEDDHGAVWSKKVKGNDGTWRRQSLETWGSFSFDQDDRWPHTHRMLLTVGRTGNCRGLDKFSGSIVPAGYQVFRVKSQSYGNS